MEFRTDIKVRYFETDKMGIVHHCNYGVWFEFARTELLESLGLPYTKIENDGFLLPVTELNIKYLKSVFFGDSVTVVLTIDKFKGASFKMNYILEKNGEKAAEGYTKHVFINKNGRPIKPHPEFIEKIQEVLLSPTE